MKIVKFDRVSAVALAAIAATVILWSQADVARAAEPLRIGIVGGLTGACASITEPALKATRLAVEEINAAGGINGRKVELVLGDSKTRPDEAAKQARDLVQTEKVELLTGVCSTPEYLAVSEVSRDLKIPLFSSLAGTHRATMDLFHPYVFIMQPSTIMEGTAIGEYAAKQGWKKIATIAWDYEWGHIAVDTFLDRLREKSSGIQVVGQYWPKYAETNFNSTISAALAQQPDAVLTVISEPSSSGFIQQGKAYGLFQRAKVITLLTTDILMHLGDQVPEGIYGWARAPFYALNTSKGRAFTAKYRKQFNEYPADWAVMAYDTMHWIAEAANKAGGIKDIEKLRQTFASFDFDSARGPMRIRLFDNAAYAPEYIGVTKKVPEYPFAILTDVQLIPAASLMPSESVVQKRRDAAKK